MDNIYLLEMLGASLALKHCFFSSAGRPPRTFERYQLLCLGLRIGYEKILYK